jgi:biopolymer transport protein ExbD
MGLEVMLAPPAPGGAEFVTLKPGNPDAELKQHMRGNGPVVLRADGTATFGDVIHTIDILHGAGAKVYLTTEAK